MIEGDGMTVHRVTLSGGVTVAVEEAGAGPALVMLHAGVSERHMWDSQWGRFQTSYRVVRWDWRGFGETPHVPGPFSYAGDVLTVMDALGIDRATLMGCSFAGGVAIQLAIQHPERVSRLVLVASGVPGYQPAMPEDVQALFQEARKAFEREDVERALTILEHIWLIGPRRRAADVNPEYLARAYELLVRSDRPDNDAVSEDRGWSGVDRLGEIARPVLVVVGMEDVPPVLASAELLGARLPYVQLVRIEGVAHLPNLEQPDLFNRVVSEWLTTAR
jgi:3-oxoadipate enol-lactonase